MSTNMEIAEAERVLGLSRPYDKADFTQAYRDAVKKNHPDLGGDSKMMTKINAAKVALEKYIRAGGDTTAPLDCSDAFADAFDGSGGDRRGGDKASARGEHATGFADAMEQDRKERARDAYSSMEDAIRQAAEDMARHQRDDTSERVDASASTDEESASTNDAGDEYEVVRDARGKRGRYAPGWLYSLLRFAVFGTFFFLGSGAMHQQLETGWSAIEHAIEWGIYIGAGLLLNKWVARLILRLLGMRAPD